MDFVDKTMDKVEQADEGHGMRMDVVLNLG
jgi:hypothetical protein